MNKHVPMHMCHDDHVLNRGVIVLDIDFLLVIPVY